jgi:hypothetical protein
MIVTIDGVWIGNWIDWSLTPSNHCYEIVKISFHLIIRNPAIIKAVLMFINY